MRCANENDGARIDALARAKFLCTVPSLCGGLPDMAKTKRSEQSPATSARSVGSIVNDLARQFKASFDRRSKQLDFTRPQWQLLLHLNRYPGMTQTRLAAALELSVPTVANLVHRLVARGWIEIKIDPAHRRNKYLYLRAVAQPKLREVHRVAHEVDSQSLEGMSARDVQQLFNLLSKIKHNLNAPQNTELFAQSAGQTKGRPKKSRRLVTLHAVKEKGQRLEN
jgi:DNA-binding MarR family transcriptional regulator